MNNKKLLWLLIMVCLLSTSAFAAKYKVNTGGKVTNSSGKVQQQTVIPQQVNTYSSSNYVTNKIVTANPVGNIDIVMDYSGSMSNWINVAKNTMNSIVNQIPASTKIGFRVFGQNYGSNPYTPLVVQANKIIKGTNGKYRAVASHGNNYLGITTGSCAATSQVVPVTTYNVSRLTTGMTNTKIGGSTPLTYALHQAVYQDFANFPSNYTKKIILITDGGENCGGNPCAFVKDLVTKRKDIVIDVVLVSSSDTSLQCLATATGGKFYNANDTYTFDYALTESVKSAPSQQTQQQNQNYEYIPD